MTDEEKRLGERMVEAEAKMAAKGAWPPPSPEAMMDRYGRGRDVGREPTLSERLDQIEALLEQLLRRVG